ncbi:hypothetical protein GGI42DRAFT_331431 [Trichoderma sp. SZMC 28013]
MSKPSFKALFEEYAAELATRSPSTLPNYVSSDVELHYKGGQKDVGLSSLQSFFAKEWSRDVNIKVLSVEELPGQDAVQIKAVDHDDVDNVVTTTYHWGKQGGKWVITKLDTEYKYWE